MSDETAEVAAPLSAPASPAPAPPAPAPPAPAPEAGHAAPPARPKLTWPEAIQAAAVLVSGSLAREVIPLPKAIERTQMFAEGLMERFG